ncbi:M36 family metallopeptidase [Planctomicrobium piriforme]|uniref:M36 family metallopeptidase n=1 Tax=Planctomicrobium piriforme TaxID=1576369 RepID=UPI00158711AD|nr:M36 family metallopeptidase [Planctomicrobium piriforme]
MLSAISGVQVPRGEHLFAQANGMLTGPQSGDPTQIAVRYLQTNYAKLGLTAADVDHLLVTSVSSDSRMTHVYLRQTWQNLQVTTADMTVTLMSDGRVLAVGNQFVSGLTGAIAAEPAAVSAADAFRIAASHLNVTVTPHLMTDLIGPATSVTFAGAGFSEQDVTAQLAYFPGDDGRLHLAWNLNVSTLDGFGASNLFVDASDGDILAAFNSGTADEFSSGSSSSLSGTSTSQDTVSSSPASFTTTSSGTGSYSVFPLPSKGAHDGPRVLVVDPADSTYSPYGWHDDNGIAGAEYTTTMGNNADAHLYRADETHDYFYKTDGGAGLNFDFPFDIGQDPFNYVDAALTQAFYVVNMAHDIFSYYGFDEAAGNFQQTNYSGEGQGDDEVLIDVQTTSSINNASIYTPSDGQSPRMRLYLYDKTDPRRDVAFDSMIILHELGHGITKRLTGGSVNTDVLELPQSAAMGEGWGDFFALMLTQKATDTADQGYGVGTYAYGQGVDGAGGRRQPYSRNMEIDPQTFANYSGSTNIHYNGEIWASALWDLNWALTDKYGYDADIKGGDGGNNLTLQLVMDALKIQPNNPTYLEGRDAILAADIALTGGANQAEIWEVFARRGMGKSANDGGSPYSHFVTAAYDVPSPAATLTLDKSMYDLGDPISITVRDGSFPGPSITVNVSTNSGDRELVTLPLLANGLYQAVLPTSTNSIATNDGLLQISPGTDIVVSYFDANTSAGTPATSSVIYAKAGVLATSYYADFNDALGAESLEGFTINNTPPNSNFAPGLWHVSSGRANDPGHSAGYSLYYGTNESSTGGGTYDVGALPTQGSVTTGSIAVPSKATLSFNYFMERENNRGAYDYSAVLISTDEGNFYPLIQKLPLTQGKFQRLTFDLADYANHNIRIMFTFNTVDNQNNQYEGWYIDDLKVSNVVDGDDQIAEAIPLGASSSVRGFLDRSNTIDFSDMDLYQITAQAGQTYQFDIDSLKEEFDGYLRLFDANGVVLAVNNDAAALGETLGQDPFLEYQFTTSGTYYLGFSGATSIYYNPITGAGDVGGAEGIYQLVAKALPTDVDDQIDEAQVISAPGEIAGSLSAVEMADAGDVGMFRIDAFAGQRLAFNLNSNFDSLLSLFDAAGNRLAWNDNAAGPSEAAGLDAYLEYTFANAGTYFIGISQTLNRWFDPVLGTNDAASPGGDYVLVTSDLSPRIDGFGSSLNYALDKPPVLLSSNVTVTDLDSANFGGGKLTVRSIGASDVADRLRIKTGGQVSVSGNQVFIDAVLIGTSRGGTGDVPLEVRLNDNATPARLEVLLRSLTFSIQSATPSMALRSIEVLLNDGDGGTSKAAAKTINIRRSTDKPVLGGFDGTLGYVDNGLPVLLDDDVTVTAPTSPDFDSGKLIVSITAGRQAADVLFLSTGGNGANQVSISGNEVSVGGLVVGTVSGGTGTASLVILLNANATVERSQTLLRAIAFRTSWENPVALPRTMQVVLQDGDGGVSTPVTKVIEVGSLTIHPENSAYREIRGQWAASPLAGADGNGSRSSTTAGAKAEWQLPTGLTGWYRIELYNVSQSNSATAAQVRVHSAAGDADLMLNQATTPTGWVTFGTYYFDGTSAAVTLSQLGTGVLRSDALRITCVTPIAASATTASPQYSETTGVWTASSLPGAEGASTRYSNSADAQARWTFSAVPAGWYQVEFFNIQNSSSTTAARFDVSATGVNFTKTLNQQALANGWAAVGYTYFEGGLTVNLSNVATGNLRTSGLRLKRMPVTQQVDQTDPGYQETTGTWSSSSITGANGTGTRYSSSPGASVQWTPAALLPGWYAVDVYTPVHPSSATNAAVDIHSASGLTTKSLNQTSGTSGWRSVGEYYFDGISASVALRQNGSGNLRSAEVRFRLVSPEIRAGLTPPAYSESVGIWNTSSLVGPDGIRSRYSNSASAAVAWEFFNLAAGYYRVEYYNVWQATSATSARIGIQHAGGESGVLLNQRTTASGWWSTGVYYFDGITIPRVTATLTGSGNLRVAAVRFVHVTPAEIPPVIFAQNGYQETSGVWLNSSLPGYNGGATRYSASAGAQAQWQLSGFSQGRYRLELYVVNHTGAAQQAQIEVQSAAGTSKTIVNQKTVPSGWYDVGDFDLRGDGTEKVSISNLAAGQLRTSAMRLIYLG